MLQNSFYNPNRAGIVSAFQYHIFSQGNFRWSEGLLTITIHMG
jgi:hypothetical protein